MTEAIKIFIKDNQTQLIVGAVLSTLLIYKVYTMDRRIKELENQKPI